ncbi:MAG: hypothetical protein E6447_12885, partial [Bradyrhizobium sp.]|nr:hypothetical protein [Bradyrhizobium sp.]
MKGMTRMRRDASPDFDAEQIDAARSNLDQHLAAPRHRLRDRGEPGWLHRPAEYSGSPWSRSCWPAFPGDGLLRRHCSFGRDRLDRARHRFDQGI